MNLFTATSATKDKNLDLKSMDLIVCSMFVAIVALVAVKGVYL